MVQLKILDPRGSVTPGDHPPLPGLESLEGKVVGILDNGQANATPMFQELAALLKERHAPAEILIRKKPTHMQAAPAAMLDEVIERCDAVITGLGA